MEKPKQTAEFCQNVTTNANSGQPMTAVISTISSDTNTTATKNNALQSPKPSQTHQQSIEPIDGIVENSADSRQNEDRSNVPNVNLKRKYSQMDDTSGSVENQTEIENKKIKTEHDYDSSRNGFEDSNDRPTSESVDAIENDCDDIVEDQFDEEKYSQLENVIEYAEKEYRNLGQEMIEKVIEHYFITNNVGIFIDYYTLKKRIDLNPLVKYIHQLCKSYQFQYPTMLIKFLSSYRVQELGSLAAQSPLTLNETDMQIESSFNANINEKNNSMAIVSETKQVSNAATNLDTVDVSSSPAVNSTINDSEKIIDKTPIANKKLSISASFEESSIGTREQIVERAKKEAYVMQRIAELRKKGMWSIRRLPKVQEPPRNKSHWDYLLEEMQWLAVDFAQERKWKRNTAKKCAKLTQKFHVDKEYQAEKVEKEEQLKLKRIASNCAKMVKQFWSEIEKVVEAKQEVQLNEKRKKIHDMQLRLIVDKADHYTETLAQEFIVPHKNSKTSSTCSDQESTHSQADQEFEKGSICSDDDEETIAKEEKECQQVDYSEEINALSNESEMPIEQLLAMYGIEDLYQKELGSGDTTDNETETIERDTVSMEEDSDDDEDESNSSDEDQSDNDGVDSSVLIQYDNKRNEKNQTNDDDLNNIAAGAESIQPKGNTLSSVQVITKVPFLLKYQLREYQHIGLDWLVAMYDKNLNGILADEMGLGKTIQTIALIAHLACEKGIWGPHLIVVPTSVMLNWEMEFKKWCPALKILTYFGNPKERRLKRKGWTKPDSFHVCITSYKLVIQDHQSFRRQKWVYFILDEAHNIKNFKSQRWQMLLNFNSTHRLLLTGTPLQNNLMELWSLMHFLMPNVFQSHREFKDWFDKPMTGMIEGQNEYNDNLIKRLHKVLRPFLLRRLKCDVEKQLPKKYEHIVRCPLSKRQRFLYDEFMSLGDTKETLSSGNFLSVINILMQLRKVCNHPNLFEPRPTISPFIDNGIAFDVPGIVTNVLDYDPLNDINILTHSLLFTHLLYRPFVNNDRTTNRYNLFQMKQVTSLNKEETIYVKLNDYKDFHRFMSGYFNPAQSLNNSKIVVNTYKLNNNQTTNETSLFKKDSFSKSIQTTTIRAKLDYKPQLEMEDVKIEITKSDDKKEKDKTLGHGVFAREENIERLKVISNEKLNRLAFYNQCRCKAYCDVCTELPNTLKLNDPIDLSKSNENCNHQCLSIFINGSIYCSHCQMAKSDIVPLDLWNSTNHLIDLLHIPKTLVNELGEIMKRYVFAVPSVLSPQIKMNVSHRISYKKIDEMNLIEDLEEKFPSSVFDVLTIPKVQLSLQLPETRLIQYDCGKLHVLDKLLWKLKYDKHRVLIFTQMSRMLDILEQFLNYHGHTYLRLDGTTKIDQRQALMERFNADQRVFCFILSTRSGGIGVNLTGADTVIFYDSDWNPTMDAQAQDRCHRIGQTRDVHIYRLVSERTVEENILKKAQQKKMLGDVAIEEGNFTTAFFKQTAIKELFDIDDNNDNVDTEPMAVDSIATGQNDSPVVTVANNNNSNTSNTAFEQALCTAEEENDVTAAKIVRAEVAAELDEFDEDIPIEEISEEKSQEEEQIEELIAQLTPLERYALKLIESSQDFHELKEAEEQIEETKKQWQKSINEWKKNHEQDRKQMIEDLNDSIMTCSREDGTITKVFMSFNCSETMPVWAPPTPPQDENDLYIDYSIGFSYENTLMTESQLPPVYIPKEHKRLRLDHSHARKPPYSNLQMNNVSSQSLHITKSNRRADDLFVIPKSLFDRSSNLICRLRREIMLLKSKSWPGTPNFVSITNKALLNYFSLGIPSSNLTSQTALSRSREACGSFNLNRIPKLTIHEEFAIVYVLFYLQELPFNLSVIYPGHTPNWDFVTEQVNMVNCFKRSAKLCKCHFELLMTVKEEQRLHMNGIDGASQKISNASIKQTKSTKKAKNQAALLQQQQQQQQPPQPQMTPYPSNFPMVSSASPVGIAANNPSTSVATSKTQSHLITVYGTQLIRMSNIIKNMIADQNRQFTNEMNQRFAAIKQMVVQKTQTSKSLLNMQQRKYDLSPIFLARDIKFDQPLSVEEVAIRRAERINREKQAQREAREVNRNEQMQQLQQQQQQQQVQTVPQQFKAAFAVPVAASPNATINQFPVNSPNNVTRVSIAATGNVHPQQQSQSPQILLNATASTSGTFVTNQQVQQLLASKAAAAAAKLQNLVAVAGDGTNISDSNLVNAKVMNSQISNSPSSQTIHHVSLTQAQSMGLISQGVATSIATLSQAPSDASTNVSNLTHINPTNASQTQATAGTTPQFMISQPSGNNPAVPVNVSIGQQQPQQISHKLFAISPAGTNPTSANIAQVTPQLFTAGQLARPSKYLVRPNNRAQLLHPSSSVHYNPSGFQVTSQQRQIHMQTVRTQTGAASTGVTTQRLQLVSSNQLAQSLISSGKILATTLITSTTNTSNAQTTSTLIGSQCILTSSSSQSSGAQVTSIAAKTDNSNNQQPQQQFINRNLRKSHSTLAANLMTGGQQTTSQPQIFVQQSQTPQQQQQQQQQQLPVSSTDGTIQTQQTISLPSNIVKTISTNIQPGNAVPFSAATFTLPAGQTVGKILNQSTSQLTTSQLRFVKQPTKANQTLSTTTGQTSTAKIVQQQNANTSLVSGDQQQQQQQQQTNRSANIIAPLLTQTSNSPNATKIQRGHTYHFVSTSSNGHTLPTGQPILQPSISVSKTVLPPGSLVQQAGPGGTLKNSIIVQQTPQQIANSGSVTTVAGAGQQQQASTVASQTTNSAANPLPSSTSCTQPSAATAAANFILTQQQHLKTTTSSQQQHFIAVSSNDSSVNTTTIKLLPTSATTIAIQQQGQTAQQASSSASTAAGLQQNISTPKGHIIISGHGASIVGQSTGSNTTSSQLTAISASPTLLHQVVNNPSSSNTNQTLTFAIRTAATGHGQTLTQSQTQPNTLHLSALTLKNPNSSSNSGTLSIQQVQPNTTTSVSGQPQTSALVAALSQSSSNCEQTSGATTVTASSALLRSLATSNVSKAIPIVLMQSSQNPNLLTQTTSGPVSLINIAGNTVSTSNNQQPQPQGTPQAARPTVSNKITTATQTSGATLGSILSAAAKVSTDTQYNTTSTSQISTNTTSSKGNEQQQTQQSPLIEALMSSLKQPVSNQKDSKINDNEPKESN